jgi:hypothetical protein
MNTRKKPFAIVSITMIAFFAFFLSGCSKESSLEPAVSGLDANTDVAESVAGAVGETSGGVVEQVGDVIDLTNQLRLGKTMADGFIDHREATFDETTGIWTLIIERERGTIGTVPFGTWTRTFTYQFLNSAGEAQKLFITDGDTATSINYNIVEGDGYYKNFRLSHDLKEIEASFVATNTNTDLVTVNGVYKRAAVDTITTQSFTRISDHALELNIIDVMGPKGSRRNLAQKVSGTITGTFHADIIFDGERGYAEKTVDKEITIVIGEGEAAIEVNGNVYMSDIESGQVK